MRSIVYITSYIPIHALSMFESLSKKFDNFIMILSKPVQTIRPWGEKHGNIKVVVQKSITIQRSKRYAKYGWYSPILIPISTLNDLKNCKPSVIISLELGFRTLLSWIHCRLQHDCKIIAHVRVSEYTEVDRGFFRSLIRKFLLKRMDHVIINGHSGEKYLGSICHSIKNISVITCGTDIATFGGTPPPKKQSDIFKLLYVGQLIHRKYLLGIMPLLCQEIARSDREVELNIAGWGNEKELLLHYPTPKNFKLKWLGQVEYNQLSQIYYSVDAFVLPTLADEWAMVVNEAMVCGLPILGSIRAQAVSELVEDNVHGWVFDPINEESLRNAIGRMLNMTNDGICKMGTAARIKALQNSDIKEADMIAEIIKTLQ